MNKDDSPIPVLINAWDVKVQSAFIGNSDP